MAHAPDGTLLDILDEGKWKEEQNPEDAPQGKESGHGGKGNGCGGPAYHMRGHGRRGGPGGAHKCGGTRKYDLEPPGPTNILNQLVAALHDAGLEGNPRCQ